MKQLINQSIDQLINESSEWLSIDQPGTHIKTRQIFPISINHIDKFVRGAVLSKHDFRIEDFVFVQNELDQFQVDLRQRYGSVEFDATAFLDFEVNFRRFPIETDADALQLFLQKSPRKSKWGKANRSLCVREEKDDFCRLAYFWTSPFSASNILKIKRNYRQI